MNWGRLAEEVTKRRGALGYSSRRAFSAATHFAVKTLADLEQQRRTNFDLGTLSRLEAALQWPDGRVEEILGSGEQADREPSWLSTPEGIARHLHRDDLPLVALLHRAGLTETDLFRLILKVRARREQHNAELLTDVAADIRTLGGWAPDVAYPPLWLLEDEHRTG